VPVREIKTEKPSSRGIFYDDVLVKRFDFEGVKKGAIGTVRYKEVIKDPHTLSSFMFGRYIPVLNGEFSVTFPASVKLSYKTYGDMKGVDFRTTQGRGTTTYSWKTGTFPPSPTSRMRPTCATSRRRCFSSSKNTPSTARPSPCCRTNASCSTTT
jgi:hypothetical protein